MSLINDSDTNHSFILEVLVLFDAKRTWLFCGSLSELSSNNQPIENVVNGERFFNFHHHQNLNFSRNYD